MVVAQTCSLFHAISYLFQYTVKLKRHMKLVKLRADWGKYYILKKTHGTGLKLAERIYRWHVWRTRKNPGHLKDFQQDEIKLSADLRNVVAVSVPLTNEWGEEYGSRVEKITAENAGRRIDRDRETIQKLREELLEARFWMQSLKGTSFILLLISILLFVLFSTQVI